MNSSAGFFGRLGSLPMNLAAITYVQSGMKSLSFHLCPSAYSTKPKRGTRRRIDHLAPAGERKGSFPLLFPPAGLGSQNDTPAQNSST